MELPADAKLTPSLLEQLEPVHYPHFKLFFADEAGTVLRQSHDSRPAKVGTDERNQILWRQFFPCRSLRALLAKGDYILGTNHLLHEITCLDDCLTNELLAKAFRILIAPFTAAGENRWCVVCERSREDQLFRAVATARFLDLPENATLEQLAELYGNGPGEIWQPCEPVRVQFTMELPPELLKEFLDKKLKSLSKPHPKKPRKAKRP